jgi:hypothetical protein
VAKLARDRGEQLVREPDKVVAELEARLRKDFEHRGEFNRVHVLPSGGADVPDDMESRLVVLGSDYPYSKDKESVAEMAATALLESRGNAPRIFRNTLVFLAADNTRLQDLEEALRRYLAWKSIVSERVELNLTPNQVAQAETQLNAANATVLARLPETYQWLLVPSQATPQAAVTWEALRLTGQDALAARVGKKLRSDELLIAALGASRLRMEMDKVPLWRGNHVSVALLAQDFASYLYLPRLKQPSVIADAARTGVSLLTWEQDSFAYAESWDETAGRYRGLRHNTTVMLTSDDKGVLVKSDVARAQLDREAAIQVPHVPAPPSALPGEPTQRPEPGTPSSPTGTPVAPPATPRPKRFYGTVTLNAQRVGRDAAQIAEEVIAHLAGQVGSEVTVTLEINALLPDGASDALLRTVTENARVLKFDGHGFEAD